jgi:23S rRNA pseudouridine2605 synthase
MSSGLIFFTNDGAFAAHLGHPGCGIEKEYFVEAAGYVPDTAIDAFNEGITIEGIYYKAKKVQRIDKKSLQIILIEGKNREIRRVFSYFRLHAKLLRRIRIGSVLLGNLEEGNSRPLIEKEKNGLYSIVYGLSGKELANSLPDKDLQSEFPDNS